MLRTFIRLLKRLAVLLPIIAVAYLSVKNIYPWLNDHLPVVFAAVITYVLGAYVLVPGILRIFRIFVPVTHLPYYSVTRDGFASDPLNIALIGTREQLVEVLTAVGWSQAERLTLRSALRTALSTIYGWEYRQAPVSSLYLFGRKQDEAFQLPLDGNARSRHHVRFWATTYNDDDQLKARSINWQHRQAHLKHDQLLWVGAASRDIGISFIRHSAQLTHLVDPDTNSERDLLVDQLTDLKQVRRKRTIKLVAPYRLTNIRAWTGYLQTDGKMIILEITAPATDASPSPQR